MYDGALPSGNSVAALQILRLGQMTGDLSLTDKGIRTFSTFEKEVAEYPSGHTFFMQSLLAYVMPKKEIIIFKDKDDTETKKLIKDLQKSFRPNYSLLVAEEPKDFKDIVDVASQYKMIFGHTTIYICEDYACQQPTTNYTEIIINTEYNYRCYIHTYSYNKHKIKNLREEESILSKTCQKKEYCKKCRKETMHTLREDALEISSHCHECNRQQEIIKTFF
ncbi:hypothetical protein J5Z55_18875 [Priestia aryabhattai]|nr:hypothetical protein [Priestia aryabhattai]QTL48126.1 hypothetical protein J5Z55_18875 [Priestia aryabhattai]